MIMVNFAAKHFRKVLELTLWINLIGCAIAGWKIGGTIGYSGHPFIGLLLGLIVGALSNVIYGGLIAICINMHEGIKNINKWLQYIWQNRINTDEKKKWPEPLSDNDIYYFE